MYHILNFLENWLLVLAGIVDKKFCVTMTTKRYSKFTTEENQAELDETKPNGEKNDIIEYWNE